MTENKENPKVVSLMNWIRLTIPIIIAALGWYIGQLVGNLNTRLDDLETKQESLINYRSRNEQAMSDVLRRLNDHKENNNNFITRKEFDSIIRQEERRIGRLEDRIDQQNTN